MTVNQSTTARSSQRLTTAEEYRSLLDKYDTFLFDCDGVIWTGPTLVPGIKEVLTMLRKEGESVEGLVS